MLMCSQLHSEILSLPLHISLQSKQKIKAVLIDYNKDATSHRGLLGLEQRWQAHFPLEALLARGLLLRLQLTSTEVALDREEGALSLPWGLVQASVSLPWGLVPNRSWSPRYCQWYPV